MMRKQKFFLHSALALACLASLGASAQTAPTAGSPARPSDAAAAAPVILQRVELAGAQSLSAAQQEALLAPWLGQSLTPALLRELRQAIERKYLQDLRLIAVTQVPQQDVTEGVLRIEVAEARLGQVQVQAPAGRSLSHIDAERAQALFSTAQAGSGALNLDGVDRATSLLNEWPGLEASSSLQAGAKPGETDVLLALRDKSALSAQVRGDNGGARGTGANRVSGDANWVLPGGSGSSVALGLVKSSGSKMARLSAETALGLSGWRGSLYGSAMDYKLVTDDFNALDVKGPSNAWGGSLNWAMHRFAGLSTNLGLNAEQRKFDNRILDTVLSKYSIQALTARLSQQWQAPGSKTLMQYELGLSRGHVNLNGSPNQESDAQAARTAGAYWVLRLSSQIRHAFTPAHALQLRASVQTANKNLDVAERMAIAGPSAVRAYPVGEATGSAAMVLNAEWQHALAGYGLSGTTVALFADHGQAGQLIDTRFEGAPVNNRIRMSGLGLWLEWRAPNLPLSARLTVAQPRGPQPIPGEPQRNQDGSRIGTRLWAQAQLAF